MKFLLFIHLFGLILLQLQADVKSTNGIIKFDVNLDNSEEATLNQTGLGIGLTPSTNLHVIGNAIVTQSLTLGTTNTSNSNLHISGTVGISFETLSSNISISENDTSSLIFLDNSSANLSVSLPFAGNVSGRQVTLKTNSDSFHTIISGGNVNIDHRPFIKLSNFGSCTLTSDGNDWFIINSNSLTEAWTPVLASTFLWIDASKASSISTSNGNIDIWNDLSDQSYQFLPTTSLKRPAWASELLNNRPVASFDGANDFLEISSGPQPGSDNQMMLYIAKLNDNHDGRVLTLKDGSGTRNGLLPNHSSDVRYVHAGTFIPVDRSPSVTGSPIMLAGYRDGNTVGVSLNGEAATTAANGADAATITDWVLGSFNGSGSLLKGYIAEVVVVNNYNSDDFSKIQGYLAWKWGLNGDLDAAHPYKNAPPFEE